MYFQVAPLPLPFSIEWNGQLAVPVDGAYGFEATATDSSQVFIDEREISRDRPVSLTAGWHPIRVRYEAHSGFSHIELRWKPPAQEWAIVPSEFLLPSTSVSATQPLPEPLPVARTPANQTDVTAQTGGLSTVWTFEPGPDSRPTGVAVDDEDNVYVVDSGSNKLYKLDSTGHTLWTADPPPDDSGRAHLSAVAVTPGGAVLVLDGESGRISRFESGGQYAGVLAQDAATYHPRGLAVGENGDIYLADTGGGRELHLSADGKQLGQIGGSDNASAGLGQPTGVGVNSGGDVILVDPAARQVFHFAPSGASRARWDFAGGPTTDGPQVALDRRNRIWVSDPGSGRVEAFSIDGTALGTYQPVGGLASPSGVAVGAGYLVVTEPGAGRVRKFALP
jgi:DNA-binding beta-propeller fold protein YncE